DVLHLPNPVDAEARAENAHHRVGLTAERDRSADDRRVAAEPSRPQAVAEDGDLRHAPPILLVRECAPAKDRRTEQAEERGADLAAAELLRRVAAGVVDDVAGDRGHV